MTARTATSQDTESIERELMALGEAPASAEELALLGETEAEARVEAGAEALAHVARLLELAEPLEFEDLSELETHRAWRTIEQRTSEPQLGKPTAARPQGSEAHGDPSPHPHGGGPRRWLFAAVGVAAAAAVLFIILRPTDPTRPDPITAESRVDPQAVAELGAQARASLKVLDDGTTDTQRAAQLADAYKAQLEEQGG
jgi:hypothetical protein